MTIETKSIAAIRRNSAHSLMAERSFVAEVELVNIVILKLLVKMLMLTKMLMMIVMMMNAKMEHMALRRLIIPSNRFYKPTQSICLPASPFREDIFKKTKKCIEDFFLLLQLLCERYNEYRFFCRLLSKMNSSSTSSIFVVHCKNTSKKTTLTIEQSIKLA